MTINYTNLFQGSNWVWSLDGWDKLKEFDIYVYGAIDTFSRRLLWLHAFTTNRDPYIVAKYYFQFVCSERGMVFVICKGKVDRNGNL